MQSDMGVMEPAEFPMSEDSEAVPASPKKGLNLRPPIRTARRKALLIAGITGAMTAAMWRLAALAPPTYAGNFQILVEPVTSEAKLAEPSTLTRTGGTPDDKLYSLDYPTQLEILKSPGMLEGVVKLVRTRHPNFGINALRKGLIVERIGKGRYDSTKILSVSYQGLDPDVVDFVLKKTAEKYLKYSLEERKTRIGQGVKFIEEQLPDLQERVDTFQAQLQQLQQQYELIDPNTRGEELYGQIRQFESEQLATAKELQELRTLSATLQRQLQLTPEQARVAADLSENPYRSNLQAQLKQIESEIAVQSATFREDSPEIQLLRQQQQEVFNLLEQETQQIPGANAAGIRDNPNVLAPPTSLRQGQIQQLVETDNQIQLLAVRLQTLAQVRSTVEREASEFPEVTRRYTDIQQKLELTKQTLNQLLAQREKLRVESAQDNVPWELISPPQIPRDPATGQAVALPADSSKKLMMGVMGGLVLGLVAAIALEKWRDIFYTTDDLQDAVQPPILGDIPALEPVGSTGVAADLALEFPGAIIDPHFLDAFDAFYANLRFLHASAPIRSLTIGSAESGDGKSVVALHLARTVANMGQRVLLVDANLRHPQLHDRLGIPNRKGLSELLTDKLVPNALVEPSSLADNLFVLTAGQPSAKSIKLLGSAQMQHIADEFQATFDFVIYDTPPLGDVMDAIFLAAQTDNILMVVAVQKTHQSNTLKVLEQLNAFRLPCVGIVANHTPVNASHELPPEFDSSTPEFEIDPDTTLETPNPDKQGHLNRKLRF